MFFSNKSNSKNRSREKKRDRNIYGVFGRSDSDNSDSGDEDRYKPILKYSDSSSDNYESDDSGNFNKYKKNTNKNKYNKDYNKKTSSKNEKNPKRIDFLGFVSGGTLNLSQVDSSTPSTAKEQFTTEQQSKDYNSDMELNSDEELLSQVIDYDGYVLVEEDEQLLLEKRKQLKMENQMREHYQEQYDYNFNSTSYRDKQYEEQYDQLPQDNDTLKEDKMKKIYGKGLNMLKKMGYKGGGLGREGKGLVNPLSFSSSKDNSSVYKIEELDKHEKQSQNKLTHSGLLPKSMEGIQNIGVSEGNNWLEWLNKRYNQSINEKEKVENKRKEINNLNLRLNEEIKLLNLEVQKKLKLLEDLEKLRPKVENKYKEYIELLNKINNNISNSNNRDEDNDDSSNNSNNNDSKDKDNKVKVDSNRDNYNNMDQGSEQYPDVHIDEVVDKLIKLLKLLNKVHYENKMNKLAVRLTFKNLFDSNFKRDLFSNLNRYEKFFISLPLINNYLCNQRVGVDYRKLLTYDSSNNSNNNEEIKDLLNYYVINTLMEYYRDGWDPVNVEKGLNLYQFIHFHLSKFYENNTNSNNDDDNTNNSNTGNNSNIYSNSSGNYNNGSNLKKLSSDVGSNAVINEIDRKLIKYIKTINDPKDLYNCHIFIFPWLQYFQKEQIHQLVEVFLDNLFRNTGELMVSKDEKVNSSQNKNNTNINNSNNNDIRTDNNSDTNFSNYFQLDNVERYENIFNNWNKLMNNKKDFENRLYDKLYNQLSNLNMNLIFSLNANYENNNGNDNSSNKSNINSNNDNNNTNNNNSNNKHKLNELINMTLSWDKLIDEETMVKLLFNTILLKFRQFLVQSISSLSRNYDKYNNNSNESNKVLKIQREKIVEFYVYFKSLLPNYVKNNKNVQEYCFKVVLNKMESFVNCYSNIGTEKTASNNDNNTNNSNTGNNSNIYSNSSSNYNNNNKDYLYDRDYESEESSGSGIEDY